MSRSFELKVKPFIQALALVNKLCKVYLSNLFQASDLFLLPLKISEMSYYEMSYYVKYKKL